MNVALRVCRGMYVRHEAGASKQEISLFRSECCISIQVLTKSKAGSEQTAHRRPHKRPAPSGTDAAKQAGKDKEAAKAAKREKKKLKLEAVQDETTSKAPSSAVVETSPDFRQEDSGLDDDKLSRLPPETPADHEAWRRCSWCPPEKGARAFCRSPDGKHRALRVSVFRLDDNKYAALRICRSMYVRFAAGATSEETRVYRDECISTFCGGVPAASGDDGTNNSATVQDPAAVSDGERSSKSSSSSSSSSSSGEENAAPTVQIGKQRCSPSLVCAKLSARTGLRCVCHYSLQCPSRR